MERLKTICQPSKESFFSQLLLLKEKIQENEGSLEFVHKFLVKVQKEEQIYYIKLNTLDHEFYVLSTREPIRLFTSFHELKDWLTQQFILS